MQNRNLSPYEGVWAWIHSEKPELSFDGSTHEDYTRWRKGFKTKLIRLLGKTPEKVPLNPETIESVDMGGYTREKVIFDSERYNSVPAYLLSSQLTVTAGERSMSAELSKIRKNTIA